jgi:hypothetical protein
VTLAFTHLFTFFMAAPISRQTRHGSDAGQA